MFPTSSSIQEAQFTCDCCGMKLASAEFLREHKFKQGCSVKTIQARILSEKLRRIVLKNGESGWLCNYCPFISKTPKGIKAHTRVHKGLKKRFVCYWCGITFAKPETLLFHKQKHQAKPKDKPLQRKHYQCSLCPYAVSHFSKYKQHLTKHSGKKLFSCPSVGCEYKSSFTNDIKRHAHKHLNDSLPPHSCDQCNYRSHYSSDVIKHKKRVHSSEKPHVCPHSDCSYRAAVRSSLTSHLARAHAPSGGEQLHCAHCRFTTVNKSILVRHIRTHLTKEVEKKRLRRKLPGISETPVSA